MENHNSEYRHYESVHHNKRKMKALNKCLKACKKNPWIMVTGILVVILVIVLFTGNSVTGSVSADEAGRKIIDFAAAQGAQAELVEVNEKNGFYEVVLLMQGQELPLYVTKDGEYFAQALVPLNAENQPPAQQQQQAQAQTQTAYSGEDLVKIKEFSQCLADNGVKAYGAGWCGYCNKLKEAFGGAEQIDPFYLECQNADRTPTEYAELCSQEQISGFPTIKINGEIYQGSRTIEGLAGAIEACDAPELSNDGEIVQQTTQTQQVQTQTGYTEEDLTKITEFSGCLAEKGVKIYGADWCGWTKKFVIETLGGADTIAPIYVECTTEADECSEAGVTGYPTTQINGETYTGARTIEGLAQATGCIAPELEGSVQQAAVDPSAGNC